MHKVSDKEEGKEYKGKSYLRFSRLLLAELLPCTGEICGRSICIQHVSFLLKEIYDRNQFPTGIELYILNHFSSVNIKSGLYHYRYEFNELEYIDEHPHSDTLKAAEPLGTLFIFTGKFGEEKQQDILLNVGASSGDIAKKAHTLGYKARRITSDSHRNLEDILDIDGVSESVICAINLGK